MSAEPDRLTQLLRAGAELSRHKAVVDTLVAGRLLPPWALECHELSPEGRSHIATALMWLARIDQGYAVDDRHDALGDEAQSLRWAAFAASYAAERAPKYEAEPVRMDVP